MKILFIIIILSNAVYLIRDKSIFYGIFVIISKNPITLLLFFIALFFFIVGYSMLLGRNFFNFSSPPRPNAFVNLPLESSLHTGIKKIKILLYSKRFNLILSIGGLITLLLPLKGFFFLLNLMEYFPLVSAIYACLFAAVSLLCRKKDLPDLLGFIYIITYAFLIAFCIHQCNSHGLYFFLSSIISTGLLFIGSDYSFNISSKIGLFMDNQGPSTGGQQQDQYQSNVNQATSHDPSLNITSENDKIRVEGIYYNEERYFAHSKSLLNHSVTAFSKFWDKTKQDFFNPTVSEEEREARIEEAKKRCNLMETRLNTALNHRNRASDAHASFRIWALRHNYNLYSSRYWISNQKPDFVIEKAGRQIAEFRDPNWSFNQR